MPRTKHDLSLSPTTSDARAPDGGSQADGTLSGKEHHDDGAGTSGSRHRLPHWVGHQLLWPLAAFVGASLLLMVFGGDRWLAEHVYAWEGDGWALRESFVTTTLIHETGKRLSILAWLGVVAAAIVAWRKPSLQAWRRPLLCLALSVLASSLLVSVLKHMTHMDCPWDLQGFGGTRPYIGLFTLRPAGLAASGCFPAGQAVAGYSWVALYFFFVAMRPAKRWLGLGIGLGAGLLFGFSQQLRGAHFLSHDVWTLMISWLVALMMYRWLVQGGSDRHARGPAQHHDPDPREPMPIQDV